MKRFALHAKQPAEANITPFTVSRVMSEWQCGGILAKKRGKVLLPSPERLLLQDV